MDGFITIPNAILNDENLSHTEMVLYGYILSLSSKEWYCFATNKALWEYIKRDKFRISKMISNLKNWWYIEVIEWQLRKIMPIVKNDKGIVKNDKGYCQKWQPYIDKVIKDLSKDKSIGDRCSVDDLVEAYKSDKLLPQMLKDVSLVQQRAEYKQAKKNRAYKSISWFLQQLKVCITTVRNNDMRWDTELRFRFALNQAMEKERKSMYWNDNTEAEYQSRKKLYLLEQKQNE